VSRPGTARNSNGPGQPEIQTIRAFSGLDRAGPGGPNVHLYLAAPIAARYAAFSHGVYGCLPTLRIRRLRGADDLLG
jgi:hypothetical protein